MCAFHTSYFWQFILNTENILGIQFFCSFRKLYCYTPKCMITSTGLKSYLCWTGLLKNFPSFESFLALFPRSGANQSQFSLNHRCLQNVSSKVLKFKFELLDDRIMTPNRKEKHLGENWFILFFPQPFIKDLKCFQWFESIWYRTKTALEQRIKKCSGV